MLIVRGTLCKTRSWYLYLQDLSLQRDSCAECLHAQLSVIVRNALEAGQLLGVHASKLAKRTRGRIFLSLPAANFWPSAPNPLGPRNPNPSICPLPSSEPTSSPFQYWRLRAEGKTIMGLFDFVTAPTSYQNAQAIGSLGRREQVSLASTVVNGLQE